MILFWELEAGRALRAAEEVLELPKIAWFGTVRAPELPDPSLLMEGIFRQLLGGSAETASDADAGPDALYRVGFEREPRATAPETRSMLRPKHALRPPPEMGMETTHLLRRCIAASLARAA